MDRRWNRSSSPTVMHHILPRAMVDHPSVSFEPLTPTAFLTRAAIVHRDRTAVIDGDRRWTYAELSDRARRQAGALLAMGCGHGARVAVLSANSHVLLEAHYGVPLAGAVLVALNARLSAPELGRLLEHSGARVLFCDTQTGRPRARRGSAFRRYPGHRGGRRVRGAARRRSAPRGGGRRRARADGDQLHERHHRTPQGRHVPPSRRVPAGAGDGVPHSAARRRRLPVDAADVSLQRLVLHLGGDRGRRHAPLPARDRPRPHLAAHPR